MRSFAEILIEQTRLHPSMRAQDVVKLCTQAARGAEHLLRDPDAARRMLDNEFAETEPDANVPMTEDISEAVCRVNLAAWKAAGRSADALEKLFLASAQVYADGEARLKAYLAEAERVILAGNTPVSPDDWQTYLEKYAEMGMPAVHHSAEYREKEKPAYRIVRRDLLNV